VALVRQGCCVSLVPLLTIITGAALAAIWRGAHGRHAPLTVRCRRPAPGIPARSRRPGPPARRFGASVNATKGKGRWPLSPATLRAMLSGHGPRTKGALTHGPAWRAELNMSDFLTQTRTLSEASALPESGHPFIDGLSHSRRCRHRLAARRAAHALSPRPASARMRNHIRSVV
jgi:hypothetical protein